MGPGGGGGGRGGGGGGGGERAGGQRVDGDGPGGEVEGHGAGERDQAALGGGVDAAVLAGDEAEDGADVDDSAPAAILHLGRESAGQHHRGRQVQLDDPIPIGVLDAVDRLGDVVA